MKTPECREEPEARENFERGMITLFKVPKEAIGSRKKRGQETHCPKKKKRGKD
jgi:hypothetical protein